MKEYQRLAGNAVRRQAAWETTKDLWLSADDLRSSDRQRFNISRSLEQQTKQLFATEYVF